MLTMRLIAPSMDLFWPPGRPEGISRFPVRLARPAGFEPATRCLEGTVGPSRDVAWRRYTSHLPAVTVAGCRKRRARSASVGSPVGSLRSARFRQFRIDEINVE